DNSGILTFAANSGERATFDANGLLDLVQEPDGRLMKVCRDGDGFPVQVRSENNCDPTPAEKQLTFTDANGDDQIDLIEARDGTQVEIAYNDDERVSSISAPHAASNSTPGGTEFAYTPAGQMEQISRIVDGSGPSATKVVEVVNHYDSLGRVDGQD